MSNFTIENLISIPASAVPSGTLVIKSGQNAFIAGNIFQGIDTSDATASAQLILSGYTAYVDGTKIEGTIPTVTATHFANNVIIPSGFIAEQEQITIPDSNITVEGNQVTVNTGYIADNTIINIGTSIATSSITPGVSNIIIPSGSFLNGDQIILGDANLVPSSIVSGVTIFGVRGSYTTLPVTDLYQCTEIIPDSWSGKKLIANNGSPEFDSTITSGLTFNGFDPVTGMIYMVTNNQIVACLSSLIPENIKAGSEILGISGSYSGTDVTLGVVDDNNNFQALAFDGTSAVTSGDALSTESFYTWNSPYNQNEEN